MTLDAAVAELGAVRAHRALRAFAMERSEFGGGWIDCPLALAYGEPHQLLKRINSPQGGLMRRAAKELRMSLEAVTEITLHWDDGIFPGPSLRSKLHEALQQIARAQ